MDSARMVCLNVFCMCWLPPCFVLCGVLSVGVYILFCVGVVLGFVMEGGENFISGVLLLQ